MRDEWFSDHLDLPKWASVHHLATEHQLKHVAHVAFFRPSHPRPELTVGGEAVPTPDAIWDYFRNWKRMENEALGDLRIRIFDQTWPEPSREAYVAKAVGWLGEQRQIVLLDPDTGLAPPSGGHTEHVKPEEVLQIWRTLSLGSILALYQHAPRGMGSWTAELLATRYQDLATEMGEPAIRFQVAHQNQAHPKAAIFWAQKDQPSAPANS